jgi:limonene-1,2-epoxide hydrolase
MKFATDPDFRGTIPTTSLTRRKALTATTTGIAAVLALPSRVCATDWTTTEKANVQIVNDFCAAWPSHNLDKLMSFFAGSAAYRVTETQEPVKGKEAVGERIKSFVDRVKEFEILDTLAKGPMVFNERIDHFTGGPLKSWHGVGVFFLKEGKIIEWYDYTIALDRA